MKRVENSIVIVCNFIKVTVDNTRSRVMRRFARWVWVSFYGIPRGKHKLKKRVIATIVTGVYAIRSTFFSSFYPPSS